MRRTTTMRRTDKNQLPKKALMLVPMTPLPTVCLQLWKPWRWPARDLPSWPSHVAITRTKARASLVVASLPKGKARASQKTPKARARAREKGSQVPHPARVTWLTRRRLWMSLCAWAAYLLDIGFEIVHMPTPTRPSWHRLAVCWMPKATLWTTQAGWSPAHHPFQLMQWRRKKSSSCLRMTDFRTRSMFLRIPWFLALTKSLNPLQLMSTLQFLNPTKLLIPLPLLRMSRFL